MSEEEVVTKGNKTDTSLSLSESSELHSDLSESSDLENATHSGFAKITGTRTWDAERERSHTFLTFEVLDNIAEIGKVNEEKLHEETIQKLSSQCNVTIYTKERKDIVCKDFKTLRETIEREVNLQKTTSTPRPFWVDIYNYDTPDVEYLSEIFGIHTLTTEDIVRKEEREKCEIYIDEYIFISSLLWEFQEEEMAKSHFYSVISKDFVVTFRGECNSKAAELVKFAKERIKNIKHLQVTPGWIIYILLDYIVDLMTPMARNLRTECDSMEEFSLRVSEIEQGDIMERISRDRRLVNKLQRTVSQKTEIFKMISSPKFNELKIIDEEVFIFMEDVSSHIAALEHILIDCQETLNRCYSTYTSKVSIELTKKAEKTNEVMKKLTAVSCVLLPLSLIAGLMGMNVYVPGQLDGRDSSIGWFWGIIGLMIVVAIILIFLGRWKKWF